MDQITFCTRVRINGTYYTEDQLPPGKMVELIRKKADEIMLNNHYERVEREKKAAG